MNYVIAKFKTQSRKVVRKVSSSRGKVDSIKEKLRKKERNCVRT